MDYSIKIQLGTSIGYMRTMMTSQLIYSFNCVWEDEEVIELIIKKLLIFF